MQQLESLPKWKHVQQLFLVRFILLGVVPFRRQIRILRLRRVSSKVRVTTSAGDSYDLMQE